MDDAFITAINVLEEYFSILSQRFVLWVLSWLASPFWWRAARSVMPDGRARALSVRIEKARRG